MTTHWTTTDLPATAWDPEPDDGQDDDGPYCPTHAGLWAKAHHSTASTPRSPSP